MHKEKMLGGIVKIAFTYLFILFAFIIYKFMSMHFANYMDYFANFIFFFIPFGIPAWLLFFVFSILKKKSFKNSQPKSETFESASQNSLLDKNEIIEEK